MMSNGQTVEKIAADLRSMLPTGTVDVVEAQPTYLRVTLHNGFAFILPPDFNVNHFDYVLTAILSALNSRAAADSSILH